MQQLADEPPAYVASLEMDAAHSAHHHFVLFEERRHEVLSDFRRFCAKAEVLVAYNGTIHGFPRLEQEYERAELEPLWDVRRHSGPRLVDGLYLAQALWPIPPRQHRLATLLNRLGLQIEDLQWHNALDDAKMLVALLNHDARCFLLSLNLRLVELIASAGAGSDAWDVLLSLTPRKPKQVI